MQRVGLSIPSVRQYALRSRLHKLQWQQLLDQLGRGDALLQLLDNILATRVAGDVNVLVEHLERLGGRV